MRRVDETEQAKVFQLFYWREITVVSWVGVIVIRLLRLNRRTGRKEQVTNTYPSHLRSSRQSVVYGPDAARREGYEKPFLRKPHVESPPHRK